MNLSKELARHLQEVYFGENWTSSNLREHLEDVTWEEANRQVYGINSIGTLVFHMTYYIRAVTNVLQGETLNAKDKYSFDLPPITSEEDWNGMLSQIWKEVESFATLIEELPEEKLSKVFEDKKYGSYYRNLQGIIEHSHYHLGQIVLIKKILRQLA